MKCNFLRAYIFVLMFLPALVFAEGGFFDAEAELVKVEDADYQFDLVRAQARVADA